MIQVEEGGEKSFSVSRRSNLGDSDSSLILRIEARPQHGQVLLVVSTQQNGGVREMNLTSVALVDLFDSDVRLVYRHDGSETMTDQFVLALSDDREVRSRTCHVTVVPVNDARPVLTTNSVLRVPLGSSAVITSNNLRATDDDSDDEQVYLLIYLTFFNAQLLNLLHCHPSLIYHFQFLTFGHSLARSALSPRVPKWQKLKMIG